MKVDFKINNLNKKAMTLVELLIALAILALVLFPIYEFLRQGSISWQLGENRTEVVQNARIGLDKMCDEIRHARGFYYIGSREIRFWWKDLNDDDAADPDEIITYRWGGSSGDDLTRRLDSETSSTPLANYVDNFTIEYFDDSGATTSDVNSVNFISFTLRVKKTAQSDEFVSIMRKGVHPRNLEL